MNRTMRRRACAVAAAAVAATTVAPAAFAADGPGVATAKGWELAVQANSTSVSPFGTSMYFNSATNPQVTTAGPTVGLTVSGRVNISTGLQYARAAQTGSAYETAAFVQLDAPVTGTVGIPTLSSSVSRLQVSCTSDAAGLPTGVVDTRLPVPAGLPTKPAPDTTYYFSLWRPFGTTAFFKDWQMKVVFNEQTTLANGQLQVVGMHTYYKVADTGLAGSGPITGDVKLGIVTCGKVNDANPPEAIPLADPKLAGGLAGAALLVGAFAARRRQGATR